MRTEENFFKLSNHSLCDETIIPSLFPDQILSVNEVDMTVTVAASIAVGWSEPAFAWDVTDDDVDSVSVFARDVWTPTIVNSLVRDN